MLLVDDDQAQVAHRREHRRARADAQPRLSTAQPLPLVVALAQSQLGMQDRHLVAEAPLEPARRLRGERDLRHQHKRSAALLERDLGRSQVDLRLAAAGHSVEQEVVAFPRPQGLLDRLQRGLLSGGQVARALQGRGGSGAPLQGAGSSPGRALLECHQFKLREPGERPVPRADRFPQFSGGHRAPAEHLQGRELHRPEPAALRLGERFAAGRRELGCQQGPRAGTRLRPRAGAGARRQDQRQAACRRRAVLVGYPQAEAHQVRRHAGFESRERLHQPLGRHARCRPPCRRPTPSTRRRPKGTSSTEPTSTSGIRSGMR